MNRTNRLFTEEKPFYAGESNGTMETPFVSCRCVELHAEGVEVVRSSPDGNWVAIARGNAAIEIYDVSSWSLKLRLRDEGCQSIRTLLWLPLTPAAAAAAAVAAGGNGAAAAAAAYRLTSLLPHSSSTEEEEMQQQLLRQPEISLFDWTLVSAGLHGVITLWDLRLLKIAVETSSFGGAIFSLCAAPAGISSRLFAAACDDGRLRLFQLEGAAGASVAAVAAAAAASNSQGEAAAAAVDGDGEDEYGALALTLRATLPKTKGRLLSVCWYDPSLLFAGSATSTIYRFSAAAAAGVGRGSQHVARVFLADGKMLLQQPRQQQRQHGDLTSRSSSSNGAKTVNSGNPTDDVLVWSMHAVPQLKLLLSGDSSGCVTVWGMPACVALQRLQLHAADVLNVEAVLTGSPPFLSSRSHTGPRPAAAALSNNANSKSSCSLVLVSAGVDGKLATATNNNPEAGGAWLLGPARYPHRSDIRGLTLLQRRCSGKFFQQAAAAASLGTASSSSADPAAAAAAAAAQGGMLTTLAAVTGAVDGTVCINEKFLDHVSAAEIKKLPIPVATTPLAKGFCPPARVVTAAGCKTSPTLLFACTEEGLDIWAVDEALMQSTADTCRFQEKSLPVAADSTTTEVEYMKEERAKKEQQQQQIVKLLHVSLRESLHPRCGDIAPDGALLAAGSRDGLHFFGVDFEELQVFDVEGGAACRERRGVTAVRFLSANVICFCELYIPKKGSTSKKKKKKKVQQQHALPDLLQQQQRLEEGLLEDDGVPATVASAEEERRRSSAGEGREEVMAAAAAATAAAAALEAAWETTLTQRRGFSAVATGGTAAGEDAVAAFRVCIVDVWKGRQLGECGPLSYPVRGFELSFDGQLLACLLTSGALLLLDACQSNCTPVYFLPAFPSLSVDISCCTFLYRQEEEEASSSSSDVRLCLFSPSNHYTVLSLRRVAAAAAAHVPFKETAAATEMTASESGGSVSGWRTAVAAMGRKRRRHAQEEETAAAAGRAVWLPRLSRRIRQVPRTCLPASGGSVVSAAWVDVSPRAAAAAASSVLPQQRLAATSLQQQETRQRCSVAAAEECSAETALAAAENDDAALAYVGDEEDEQQEEEEDDQQEDKGRQPSEKEEEEEETVLLRHRSKKKKKTGRRHKIAKEGNAERAPVAVAVAAASASAAEASVLYCLTASTLCRLPLLSGQRFREPRSSNSRSRRRRKHTILKKRCMAMLSSHSQQQQNAPKEYVDASSSSSSGGESGTGIEGYPGRRHLYRKTLHQQPSSSSGSSGSSCSEEEVEDNEEERRGRLRTGSAALLSPGHCSRALSSPLASAVAAAIRHATAPGSRTTVCAPPLYAAATDRSWSEKTGLSAIAAALTRFPAALRSMLLRGNGLQQRGRCLLLAYQMKQLQLLLENVATKRALFSVDLKCKKHGQLVEEKTSGGGEEERLSETGGTEDGTTRVDEDPKPQAIPKEMEEKEDEEETVNDDSVTKDPFMKNKKKQRDVKRKAKEWEALQWNGLNLATSVEVAGDANPQVAVLSTTCSSPSSLGAAAANGDAIDVQSRKSSSKSKTKKSQTEVLRSEDAFLAPTRTSHEEETAATGAEEAAVVGGAEAFMSGISVLTCDSSQGSNTTCASMGTEKKKRDGNGVGQLHKQTRQRKLRQHEQKRRLQERQHRQPQVMERLQLQPSSGCRTSIEKKWHSALARPTTIRVNSLHGFLALEIFAWPTASSSAKRQRVTPITEVQREEESQEEDKEEFAADDKDDLKRRIMKIETRGTHKKPTHVTGSARTIFTLVLIEAFSGAIALPDNMPAPFNRKRYGT